MYYICQKKRKKNFYYFLIDLLNHGFHAWVKCIGQASIVGFRLLSKQICKDSAIHRSLLVVERISIKLASIRWSHVGLHNCANIHVCSINSDTTLNNNMSAYLHMATTIFINLSTSHKLQFKAQISDNLFSDLRDNSGFQRRYFQCYYREVHTRFISELKLCYHRSILDAITGRQSHWRSSDWLLKW